MPADYHTHTPLCRHATGEPEDFAKVALAAGITEYGISDHAPMQPEPFDDWRMLEAELPAYFQWIDRAKQAAGDLPVRAGLECDWLPGCDAWTEKLSEFYPWDYLIGSVHYLGKEFDFDNPKWLGKWSELDVEETWQRYWDEYLEMVKADLFDICGHPDLIKKFSYTPAGDLARYYEPVIAAIAERNLCIEINTAGWHKPCAEQYPSEQFLKLSSQAGVGLIISSDAHASGEIGRDFERAIQLAKKCGFTETRLYKGGQFTTEPL